MAPATRHSIWFLQLAQVPARRCSRAPGLSCLRPRVRQGQDARLAQLAQSGNSALKPSHSPTPAACNSSEAILHPRRASSICNKRNGPPFHLSRSLLLPSLAGDPSAKEMHDVCYSRQEACLYSCRASAFFGAYHQRKLSINAAYKGTTTSIRCSKHGDSRPT